MVHARERRCRRGEGGGERAGRCRGAAQHRVERGEAREVVRIVGGRRRSRLTAAATAAAVAAVGAAASGRRLGVAKGRVSPGRAGQDAVEGRRRRRGKGGTRGGGAESGREGEGGRVRGGDEGEDGGGGGGEGRCERVACRVGRRDQQRAGSAALAGRWRTAVIVVGLRVAYYSQKSETINGAIIININSTPLRTFAFGSVLPLLSASPLTRVFFEAGRQVIVRPLVRVDYMRPALFHLFHLFFVVG